jgi:hypothetical protein
MRPYDVFMLALCLWALAVLAAGVFVRWTDATGRVLAYADGLVCGLFLVDFFVSFYRAPRRLRYLATWGGSICCRAFPPSMCSVGAGQRGFCDSCECFVV